MENEKNPVAEIFDTLHTCFNEGKALDILKQAEPFIINRWLSYSDDESCIENALRLSKYMYTLPKELMYQLLYYTTPKSREVKFVQFPNKQKNNEELKYLLRSFKKLYGWTDRELEINKHTILDLLKDEIIISKCVKLFGTSDTECREMGVVIQKEHTNKTGPVGLQRWANV